ncbi:MAG: ECF-type sigma factor [Phycisphaerales bacterium]
MEHPAPLDPPRPGDRTGAGGVTGAGPRETGSGAAPADAHLEAAYGELRRLAERYLRRERTDHTLQATALIHEAWFRLESTGDFEDRTHFIGIAARAMRQVLVDHARGKHAIKRGGDRQRRSLDAAEPSVDPQPDDILALDESLTRLAARHERTARVVELRAFGGLTIRETAAVLGVSSTTVEDDWTVARAWLARDLAED